MTTARHNACIIIPCYNHGATMPALLGQLAPLALPVIIVNDGSDAPTTQTLRHLATTPPHPLDITLLEHPANQGKGAATTTALREARRHGITHALQIDADGQHDTSALPALLATSREHPEALVSGHPRYDATISLTRKLARHITHAWVRLETLSCQIKDSMCGLRVYPVTPTLALLEKPRPRIGRRMDFDIEIMVRHYWAGHPVHFVPVRVTYPPDGISHFRPLRDNLRITWMHTRLFLGMLPRAPRLLARHLSKKKPNRPLPPPTHWANIPEKRGLRGMRLLFHVYRIFGYKPFARRLLHPVIFPYWLTSPRQRRTSRDWLRRIRDHATATNRPLPPRPRLTTYRHFYRFGETLLEKLAAWTGGMDIDDVEINDNGILAPFLQNPSAPGALVLTTHLGNAELCRALATRAGHKTFNTIIHTRNAARFNRILHENAPDARLNLIPAAGLTAADAIRLKEKLDAGEWLAIAADRVSIDNPGRAITVPFLGTPAPFPEGPFVLAAVLRCPVFLMFALKENGRHRIHLEPFADPLELPRATRAAALTRHAARLAARIEHHALKAPLDWFNFHDFWQPPAPVPPQP